MDHLRNAPITFPYRRVVNVVIAIPTDNRVIVFSKEREEGPNKVR